MKNSLGVTGIHQSHFFGQCFPGLSSRLLQDRNTREKISVEHCWHMTMVKDHNSWYLEVMIWLVYFLRNSRTAKPEALQKGTHVEAS